MNSRIKDARGFWTAIGCRAVGAAIVTSRNDGEPAGFLALSATHLTATPPTLMVSLDPSTAAGRALRESGSFCINYLASDQRPLLDRFLSREGPKGAERFAGLDLSTLATGAPVLPGVVGALDCAVDEIIMRHGAAIVIGTLVDAQTETGRAPLLSYAGKFT